MNDAHAIFIDLRVRDIWIYRPTDPIEADNWLIDIQVILDFMGLTEHEKVLCASFALKNDARH